MPYDSFGNFTREYNWTADKLNGIKIESERMDAEFDNYATGMNQVLLRSGVAPLQGDLKMGGFKVTGLGAGLVASPSLQFLADPTTGIYLPAPGNLGFTVSGNEKMRIVGGGGVEIYSGLSVTGNAVVAGNFNVTGTITGTLANLSVTGAMIANDTLTSAKWAPNNPYITRNAGFQFNAATLAPADVRITLAINGGEGAGNSGNDFAIFRHGNNGVAIAAPFTITRSNGHVNIGEELYLNNGGFYRTCSGANGYQSYYRIDGVSRWSWNIDTTASSLPGSLSLVAYNGAGVASAVIMTYNLQNFSAVYGSATESIYTRAGTGPWFAASPAINIIGANPTIHFQGGGGAATKIGIGQAAATLYFVDTLGTGPAFQFNTATSTGIATLWSSASDSRLKYDIQPVVSGLDVLAALTPYTYGQAVTEEAALEGIGVFNAGIIAQELIGTPLEGLVLPPPPVPEGFDGGSYYAFNYTGLTAWYIAAFKEIKTRLDDIEARLDAAGL